MALARRWPVVHLDVPPGVPKLPLLDLEPQQLALAFTRPSSFPFARWDIDGVHNIPRRRGPVLVAQPLVPAQTPSPVVGDACAAGPFASWARRRCSARRSMLGSTKPWVVSASKRPRIGQATPLCRRGAPWWQWWRSCPGHHPRGVAFFDPELKGRWETARLAAMPPRRRSSPWGCGAQRRWAPLGPAPQHPQRDEPADCADPGRAASCVEVPQRRRRHEADHEGHCGPPPRRGPRAQKPTARSCCGHFRPGYKGDPEKESSRRPGTD